MEGIITYYHKDFNSTTYNDVYKNTLIDQYGYKGLLQSSINYRTHNSIALCNLSCIEMKMGFWTQKHKIRVHG